MEEAGVVLTDDHAEEEEVVLADDRSEEIRVLLADDHKGLRDSIRKILKKEPGIIVVGEASNGLEAIDQANKLLPDILLLDMQMPILDGVQVAERLKAAGSPVCILALSAYNDRHFVEGLLENGAAGYLTKDEAPSKIVKAIRGIARGERGWLSDHAAAKLNGNRPPKVH